MQKGVHELREKKTTNKNKNIFYNIIIAILVVVIGFSLFQIGKILWGYYQGTKTYDSVAQLAGVDKSKEPKVDFEKLLAKNPDTKGWIRAEGLNINYPIVQGRDNDYYLYRMFNGEYNRKGSIFLDYRIEHPFEEFMTIVYGHNMKDSSMFSHLMDYEKQDFYEKHKKMTIFTPDQNYDLEIIGANFLDASASQYKFYFNESEKNSYISWIEANSLIKTDVKATSSDKIVMLSTCTNVDEDGRFVVFGKLMPKS